jgi:hypothetical protein
MQTQFSIMGEESGKGERKTRQTDFLASALPAE